ncbi:hypothetical protein [Methylobacterium haplocladii]|uniref:Pentapeptide MXKDX repeat protein n=1 Tax=Methylobacterium haplocladii TaxID=1176176 RepID=A0A512IJZ8_9HYPH|nr:hypothetical protein [Methylobacterium haplocladii]GEO97968.1 hypothetical protein MHA02_03560 [Methylobacterium haplocladii]GJD86019.1 hypothetical protein HPGCJGGD_3916 [Methylobacterium haplocladii]GLS57869.1 hypothetical protein GCM10007887_05250 [Methylobacterium haplocladii]
MNRISLALLTSLALTGAAFAEDKAAQPSASGKMMKAEDGKMKGPPNAAGYEKREGDATATTAPAGGAASAKATGEDKKDGKK